MQDKSWITGGPFGFVLKSSTKAVLCFTLTLPAMRWQRMFRCWKWVSNTSSMDVHCETMTTFCPFEITRWTSSMTFFILLLVLVVLKTGLDNVKKFVSSSSFCSFLFPSMFIEASCEMRSKSSLSSILASEPIDSVSVESSIVLINAGWEQAWRRRSKRTSRWCFVISLGALAAFCKEFNVLDVWDLDKSVYLLCLPRPICHFDRISNRHDLCSPAF